MEYLILRIYREKKKKLKQNMENVINNCSDSEAYLTSSKYLHNLNEKLCSTF